VRHERADVETKGKNVQKGSMKEWRGL